MPHTTDRQIVAPTAPEASTGAGRRRRRDPRGQVLIIFAGGLLAFIGITGLAIDLSQVADTSLRVQRAADAAALAGVVYLPATPASADARAMAESAKNGYANGVGPTTVTPGQDPGNPRRMNVVVSTEINTIFARLFGVNSFKITRKASAEYVLPVPMGSPLNYYGIGCLDTTGSQPACITSGNSNGASGVTDASTGSATTGAGAPMQLNSQGFWGSVFTKGGDSRNGDAYMPANVSNPNIPNSEYDPAGYGYTVEVPAGGGGRVSIFDAAFCGMPVLGSGRAGTGDEWTGNMVGSNPSTVATYYNLWNTNGTPFLLTDDTLVWASGNTFANMRQVDQSGAHGSGSPQYAAGSNGITRCDRPGDQNYQYHLKWWQIPTVLPQGTYRLQVTSTNVNTTSNGGTQIGGSSASDSAGAANRFGLEVRSNSGNPRIYGSARMEGYANIQSGTQLFYLAQIDRASGAGKTVEIDLYDPGDVGSSGSLQIMSPDGNTYTASRFSYTSKSKAGAVGPSGNNVTAVQVCCPSAFDAYWLRITIPLAATYGSSGLTPPGETQPGWWKIRYAVAGGNDTTTWEVKILGNPVHLIVP